MTPPGRPTVVMVGHFPPPVHGMAVAFQALADAFEQQARVVRISTSPSGLRRSAGYHAVRLGRWLLAIGRLVALRRRSDRVIMSVDAGFGMIYLIAGVVCARAFGYRIYLQHHSYAYLTRPSPLMRLLSRVSSRAEHLCSCRAMADDLGAAYPEIKRVRSVPLSYAVRPGATTDDGPLGVAADRPLRIGHFGNLTMDKGLATAVETAEAARADGLNIELVLGGPLGGTREEQFVDDAVRSGRGGASYVGALYGPARDEFLRDIDVLLFPSRYSHESFGLALWESLSLGTPAVAYRAGCLTSAVTGPGVAVLEPDEPFVASALDYLRPLCGDPARLHELSRTVRDDANRSIRTGRRAVSAFVGEVCATAGSGRA